MFKKFRWFIDYYKKEYIIALTFLFLSDLVGLIPPYITGKLTDLIFKGEIGFDRFIKIILFTFFVVVVKYFFAMGWSYFINRASNEIEHETRDKLIRKFLKQQLRFFEVNSTGSLMSKSTGDVYALSDLAGPGTLSFFDSTVFPICIVIMMAVAIDFKLTIVSILPLPLLAILCIKIGDKIYEKYFIAQKSFDNLNDQVLEDVEGVRIIRTFNQKEKRYEAFTEKGEKLRDDNMNVAKLEALMAPLQRIIPALTFIIAISYGSYLIKINEISVGELVSFTYYLNMLIWPMYALGNFINMKEQAEASMDRIGEVLNYKEDYVDREDAVDLKDEVFDINFNSHSFSYPSNDIKRLKDIKLKIDAGRSVGILGKTGSGKSSLIKQLLNLYKMDTSTILLDNMPYDYYTTKSIRSKIGYVPQKYMIFSKTIRENIIFGDKSKDEKDLEWALTMADFKKDVDEFTDGYETLCGEQGISLSGGQKLGFNLQELLSKNLEF